MLKEGLILQWPDTHVPDHHPGAVRSVLRHIAWFEPDLVVFTGDFADFKSVARWSSGTRDEDGRALQKEVEACKQILGQFRDIYAGPAEFRMGNHEDRLQKWLTTKGRAIYGLDVMTVPKLLDFDGFGIELPADETTPVAHNLTLFHGSRLGKRAGMSVDKEMERFSYNRSIGMGHCHRLSCAFKQTPNGSIFGVEGGHLMDQRKADYLAWGVADWQMGFATYSVTGKTVTPQIHPMNARGEIAY